MRKLRTVAHNKVTSDANEVGLAAFIILNIIFRWITPCCQNTELCIPSCLMMLLFLTNFSLSIWHWGLLRYHQSPQIQTRQLGTRICVYHQRISCREAAAAYQVGKGFFYENFILHKTFTIWKPNTSVISEHINLSRRSMVGIICLFTEAHTAGARDSEKFVNSNIKTININIDGTPNKLYSKGIVPTNF